MMKDEFNEWFAYHGARFAGVTEFIARKKSMSGQPMDQEMLAAWAGVLRDVRLEDAKAASDEMFSRPDAELPHGYDRHPAAIREIVRVNRATNPQSQRHYVDGEEVFRCSHCRDTGSFIAWHPKTVRAIREGKLARMKANPVGLPAYTVAVRCTCEAGAAGAEWMGQACDPRRIATLDRCPNLDALGALIEETGPRTYEEFQRYAGN